MPFLSQSQRKLFWARAKSSDKWKKMAEKWEAHTPKGKLPKRVGKKMKKIRDAYLAIYKRKK